MTKLSKRSISDIMTRVEHLQEQNVLPPNWMKLPGEYSDVDIKEIQYIMYQGGRDPHYSDMNRWDFLSQKHCQKDMNDTPNLRHERLCWLLTDHLRGPGGFRLWSEEMRARIWKLYQETSELGDRRKWSNALIEKDEAVRSAALDIFPAPDHTSLQLHYFFLARIVKGDTSTRKKRLEYYYSDQPMHSESLPTVLDYYYSKWRLPPDKQYLQSPPTFRAGDPLTTAIDLTSTLPDSISPHLPTQLQQSGDTPLATASGTNPQMLPPFPAHVPVRSRTNYRHSSAKLVHPNNSSSATVLASNSIPSSYGGHQRETFGTNTQTASLNPSGASHHIPLPAAQQAVQATLQRPMTPNGLQRPLRAQGSRSPLSQGIHQSPLNPASRRIGPTLNNTRSNKAIARRPQSRLATLRGDMNEQSGSSHNETTIIQGQARPILTTDQSVSNLVSGSWMATYNGPVIVNYGQAVQEYGHPQYLVQQGLAPTTESSQNDMQVVTGAVVADHGQVVPENGQGQPQHVVLHTTDADEGVVHESVEEGIAEES